MIEHGRRELAGLAAEGMLRTLRTVDGAQGPKVILDGREVLLLCANNYLGLADHPALIEAAQDATARYGVGSGGSRLISGSMRLHRQFEEALAAFKGTGGALLFNSGYAANTSILQGLLGPDDLVFSDQLNHASIIDGCRMARARTVVYPHGNTAVLEELMAAEAPKRRGRWLIVTDGVFSMDGDLAPLPALCDLKERHDALLMVDDAHGTGVLGVGGRGSAEALGCLARIDLHMGTLGKALGGFGAFVAADQVLIDLLVNRARSFIFSTSLPPAVPAAGIAALQIVASSEGAGLRQRLAANRAAFASVLQDGGLDLLGSVTQILPVLTGAPAPTMAAAQRLLQHGIFVQGIRPPTVPAGRCRLRATVMASHEAGELRQAAELLVQVVQEVNRCNL